MTNKPKRNYRKKLRDLAEERWPDLVKFDREIERRKTHLKDRDERGRKTSTLSCIIRLPARLLPVCF